MHLASPLAVLAGVAAIANAHTIPIGHRSITAFDSSTASLSDFARHALATAKARIAGSTGSCTPETVTVRKLFENLSGAERIAYTFALTCLMHLPAKTPEELVPGAKTRYDDFVAPHINQTLTIHYTASFLGWHRLFVFEIEQALRNECGYTGAIPYWDWTKTAKEGFNASELVNGSATSLSGNGGPVADAPGDAIVLPLGESTVILPMGTGGGCVTSGPFANMTVNLGPDGLVIKNNATDISSYKFKYNPRCLKRDLTIESLTRFANETSVLNLLRGGPNSWTPNIWEFET